MYTMHASLLSARGLRTLTTSAESIMAAAGQFLGETGHSSSNTSGGLSSYDLSQADMRLREAAFVEVRI